MLGEKQRDRLSAGLRHLHDAEHLATDGEHRSLDQAWHLVGFALECLRKAGLSSIEDDERIGKNLLGHDLGKKAESHLDWLIAIDARAHRYQLGRWSADCPDLVLWTPEARYERSGTVAKQRSAALTGLLKFGRERASDLLARMYIDGVLPVEEL
jgi:hypothetical protein